MDSVNDNGECEKICFVILCHNVNGYTVNMCWWNVKKDRKWCFRSGSLKTFSHETIRKASHNFEFLLVANTIHCNRVLNWINNNVAYLPWQYILEFLEEKERRVSIANLTMISTFDFSISFRIFLYLKWVYFLLAFAFFIIVDFFDL